MITSRDSIFQKEMESLFNKFVLGMYLYLLFVDGKEVDTKRMILTK
jgi:hypothetical protein